MPFDKTRIYDAVDSVIGQPLSDAQQFIADKLGVGNTLKYASSKSKEISNGGESWGEGDAARHMLLSGELHRTSPTLAPLLLYGHEAINFAQGSTRQSIQQDLDNNALGKELSRGAGSREEVERRVKLFLPYASTALGKKVSMNYPNSPLDTISMGLQALDMGKMSAEGFDVNAHHARMLSTGPFAVATQRQGIWDRVNNPQDHAQGPGYPDEGEGHAPAPVQIAQAGTGTPIGLGSNPNGKINALGKSTQAQLKALDEDAAAPLRQSTSGAVMGREGVQYDKKANPILSADAMEKDRVRRNNEMDVIEQRLRGVSPRPNETEDQRLRRMHPELY